MSALSDEIKATYDSITEQSSPSLVVAPLDENGEGIESTPGFMGAKVYYEMRVQAEIRKGYRYHAGAELRPTGQEQFDEFLSEMLGRLAPIMFSAFADGVLIGQKKIQPVLKGIDQDKLDEVFVSPAFRKDADIYSLSISGDPDVTQVIRDHLQRTAVHMSEASGYLGFTDSEVIKIWDLWVLASMSTMFSFYVIGTRLGVIWAEKDTFSAMEREFNE